MAKGKSSNPADAHRKALRKKELKKNKAERQKNRDFALVKRDTKEIEDEIVELENVAEPSSVQKARLSELKAELARINKKKEDYIEAHPEQRNLVYASSRRREKEKAEKDDDGTAASVKKQRNLFNKNGLPRHPERSIYYDPVMNPYGMPPPGMPYAERALLPGEVDSEAEANGDSDDDIMMPRGPPPGSAAKEGENSAEESDDDIPMPEGPPPQRMSELSPPPLPSGPPPTSMPPFAPPFPPHVIPGAPPFPPPLPHGAGFLPSGLPPPGFFPRRVQSMASVQDPLSAIPHQTYQAHKQTRQAQGPPLSALAQNSNLPRPPAASATVSAEPQLRDFKKESTAFVPAALKRKRAGDASGAGAGRVNAAPSLGPESEGASEPASSTAEPRADLLGTLKERLGSLGSVPTPPSDKSGAEAKKRKIDANEKQKPGDDYNKFLDEMGDILGPR